MKEKIEEFTTIGRVDSKSLELKLKLRCWMDEGEKYLKYRGLINLALKRLNVQIKSTYEKEVYMDRGIDGLLAGIRRYDASRGVKEATFVYKCIANSIKQQMSINTAQKRTGKVVSLNKEISDDGEELGDFIPSGENTEHYVFTKISDEKILKLVNELDEKSRKIVKYRWGIDGYPNLTFEEIGMIYGNDKNAIRTRYNRAVGKIYYKYRRYYDNETKL